MPDITVRKFSNQILFIGNDLKKKECLLLLYIIPTVVPPLDILSGADAVDSFFNGLCRDDVPRGIRQTLICSFGNFSIPVMGTLRLEVVPFSSKTCFIISRPLT